MSKHQRINSGHVFVFDLPFSNTYYKRCPATAVHCFIKLGTRVDFRRGRFSERQRINSALIFTFCMTFWQHLFQMEGNHQQVLIRSEECEKGCTISSRSMTKMTHIQSKSKLYLFLLFLSGNQRMQKLPIIMLFIGPNTTGPNFQIFYIDIFWVRSTHVKKGNIRILIPIKRNN